MIAGIVDTTVIVHLYRRYAPALVWYGSVADPLGVTSITWLEIIYGAGSKIKQQECKALLSQFTLVHLTTEDQDWAIQQMEAHRLAYGTATNDCLIASVAQRLQLPLYTHNLKDMIPLIGSIAIKPYI